MSANGGTMLTRYGEPGLYDHAPHGTLCKASKTLDDAYTIYVQTSLDEQQPDWQLVGVFTSECEHLIPQEAAKILAHKN